MPLFLLLSWMMVSYCQPSLAFCPAVLRPTRTDRRRQRLLQATASSYPDPPLPNFCASCGSPNMRIRIPQGDEVPRACCDDCDAVVYVNPKVVVATVVFTNDDDDDDANNNTQVLLAQRAIDPRAGYWGIPQGFMELHETSRQAAVREVYEETGVATLDPAALSLRAVYNVPGSVQLVYQVTVPDKASLDIASYTTESTAVGFFDVNALPDLCFPTVQWAIDHCVMATRTTTAAVQQKTKFYDPTTNTWGEYEEQVCSSRSNGGGGRRSLSYWMCFWSRQNRHIARCAIVLHDTMQRFSKHYRRKGK